MVDFEGRSNFLGEVFAKATRWRALHSGQNLELKAAVPTDPEVSKSSSASSRAFY